jgi:ABC-type phosphate transport system substrate-binding protein
VRKQLATIVAAALAVATLSAGTATASAAVPDRKPPRSCTDALEAGEHVASIAGDFSGTVQRFFQSVQSDAVAASGGSISDVTTFLQSLKTNADTVTSEVNSLVPDLDATVARYKPLAAKCRAGR